MLSRKQYNGNFRSEEVGAKHNNYRNCRSITVVEVIILVLVAIVEAMGNSISSISSCHNDCSDYNIVIEIITFIHYVPVQRPMLSIFSLLNSKL